jgi:hypothetical protein
MADSRLVPAGVHLLLISRNLDVILYASGRDPRQSRPPASRALSLA